MTPTVSLINTSPYCCLVEGAEKARKDSQRNVQKTRYGDKKSRKRWSKGERIGGGCNYTD